MANEIVNIYFDSNENVEYKTFLHNITKQEKLMIIGRLEEIKQDILEDLYND